MNSVKNTDGTYTIKSSAGTYLHNIPSDYYCLEANSSSSPKLTDWEQVDAPPVTPKTDNELFEQFEEQIRELVNVVRDKQSSKSTDVNYTLTLDMTGIIITEHFIEE